MARPPMYVGRAWHLEPARARQGGADAIVVASAVVSWDRNRCHSIWSTGWTLLAILMASSGGHPSAHGRETSAVPPSLGNQMTTHPPEESASGATRPGSPPTST